MSDETGLGLVDTAGVMVYHFLSLGGQEFAKKFGAIAAGRAADVLALLKQSLTNEAGQEALEELTKEPDSIPFQGQLAAQIGKALENDPGFHAKLGNLLTGIETPRASPQVAGGLTIGSFSMSNNTMIDSGDMFKVDIVNGENKNRS